MQNLELKSKIDNFEKTAKIAQQINATFIWTKKQKDTYFSVDKGKLKLREQDGLETELISYIRPNGTNEKVSNYFRAQVDNPIEIKNVLEKTCSIESVVDKTRTLYLWENVRIHLDKVKHLGFFLEFEAVMDSEQMLEISKERLTFLRKKFKITKEQLISHGYKELLERINGTIIS
jgi:adenylate cyclase, class 2